MSSRAPRALLGVTFVLASLVPVPVCAARAEVTDSAVTLLEQWTQGVMAHTPGQADRPVTIVRAWTFADRTELNPAMEMFLDMLTRVRLSDVWKKGPTPARPADRLRSLADATFRSVGVATFLQRAAVLHGDAAMAAAREPVRALASTRGPTRGSPAPRPGARAVPPLLYRASTLQDNDGELRGEVPRDWNWPFARSLLEPKMFERAEITWPRAFVTQWYHATAAFMFRNGLYSDARMHLESATAILGDDPLVLFDRACLAEVYGLPIVQNVLTERDLVTLRRREARRVENGGEMANVLGVPLLETTNGEAERLFRRTISVDPSVIEARVRLARLLLLRRRHDEALEESEAALRANPERAVSFYAHMIAGRASRALGRFDAAAAHFSEAITLFPDAQSARVAASHLSMTRADLDAALAALDPLSGLDADAPLERDPWWCYRWGSGRDTDALLAAVWASTPLGR
ncbi:MAG TPA: tetratricopeptide repeat protein [Vicinamibacterales bacterium]|nr:tetratricopeptide repeat protein [Vicinamibacterales bacterium]